MSHGTHKNKQVTSQTWSQQSHGDSLLVTPRARHHQVRKTKFLKSQLYRFIFIKFMSALTLEKFYLIAPVCVAICERAHGCREWREGVGEGGEGREGWVGADTVYACEKGQWFFVGFSVMQRVTLSCADVLESRDGQLRYRPSTHCNTLPHTATQGKDSL